MKNGALIAVFCLIGETHEFQTKNIQELVDEELTTDQEKEEES